MSDTLFAYTGRERDDETGLSYHRARYYDPAVGRWLSEDPISVAAGDTNISRYVGNNPVSVNDPTGLQGSGAGSGKRVEVILYHGSDRGEKKNPAVANGAIFKGAAESFPNKDAHRIDVSDFDEAVRKLEEIAKTHGKIALLGIFDHSESTTDHGRVQQVGDTPVNPCDFGRVKPFLTDSCLVILGGCWLADANNEWYPQYVQDVLGGEVMAFKGLAYYNSGDGGRVFKDHGVIVGQYGYKTFPSGKSPPPLRLPR